MHYSNLYLDVDVADIAGAGLGLYVRLISHFNIVRVYIMK